MANLPEDAGFVAGITQLETTDPVLGGPAGKANEAPAQLASRTRWLHHLATALRARHASNAGIEDLPYNDGFNQLLTVSIPASPHVARLLSIDAIVHLGIKEAENWSLQDHFSLYLRSGATNIAEALYPTYDNTEVGEFHLRVGAMLALPASNSTTISLHHISSLSVASKARILDAHLAVVPALNQDIS